MNPKTKIKAVNKLLIKKYGTPFRNEKPPEAVDMLIATILSQNTNDKNSHKAFLNLKEEYKTWEETALQPASSIERVIKAAGLGKQKSKAIKMFLNSLIKERGKISLDHLNEMNDDEVISELTKFGGVGVKTASCVLQFALRRNVCPVDTHVYRITNRIGIVKTNSPEKTFYLLNAVMPDKIAHSLHTNLIRLGREICKPALPNCSICPLLNVCEYEYKNFSKERTYKENSFMLLDNVF